MFLPPCKLTKLCFSLQPKPVLGKREDGVTLVKKEAASLLVNSGLKLKPEPLRGGMRGRGRGRGGHTISAAPVSVFISLVLFGRSLLATFI